MTKWGWKRTDHSGSANAGVTWVAGTLEESYDRVTGQGGSWILVSAWPVSEYHRVMQETADQLKGKS
jgi:glycogen debranching enzyme